MALLPILIYPDKRLKLVADPVVKFDDDLGTLVEDMFETMYESQGVGLAATQVDIQLRLFTMDTSRDGSDPITFVNPEIISEDDHLIWEEGCLSFPGVYAKVKRAKKITVKYQDINGNFHELEAEELEAVCIQHEIDHLNGITFFDHLSPLKRNLLKKKLTKLQEKQL